MKIVNPLIIKAKQEIRSAEGKTAYSYADFSEMKTIAALFLLEMNKIEGTVQMVIPPHKEGEKDEEQYAVETLIHIDKYHFNHSSMLIYIDNYLAKKFIKQYFYDLDIKLGSNGWGTALVIDYCNYKIKK